MNDQDQVSWIRDLELRTRAETERFLADYSTDVETYRLQLSEGIAEGIEGLRMDVSEISGNDKLCADITGYAGDYIDWLQWSLWDIPHLAVAIGPDPKRFKERVTSCAFVYLAGRVFDDVVDRHFWYKGKRPTLLGAAAENYPTSAGAEGLTILSGLLLCAQGLFRLSASDDENREALLERVLTSFRRTVVGAIMEHADPSAWSADYYERLANLKNVDFWRILYASIDPDRQSPLYPFLERYYALAQKLNDVLDFPEDQRRGQPNLLSLYMSNGARSPAPKESTGRSPAPRAFENHLVNVLRELEGIASTLPERERSVAMVKLGETLNEAFRIGLFSESQPEPSQPGEPESLDPPLGLEWYSGLADVVERLGANALVEVNCAVCGTGGRQRMLEKQGFSLYRCGECSHVYVTPRLSQEIQLRMANELEHQEADDSFLEVQRIIAEPICHLIRSRAPGSRLLDLGFGRGYVLKLAQAYGFEAYGVERSSQLLAELAPQFGKRLKMGTLGVDDIPWGSFDVIVMTHVLEHLPDPRAVLEQVWGKLNPGGILYLAVPDIDSLQFKIFGKNWTVISPLVHYQYFNEQSLSRLLTDAGFQNPERIVNPPLPRELTPRWMELMRTLGGDESGELAIVAERPALERLRVGNRYLDSPSTGAES